MLWMPDRADRVRGRLDAGEPCPSHAVCIRVPHLLASLMIVKLT